MAKGRLWTKEEIYILKQYYGILSAKKIAKMLDRSLYAVYSKAKRLGLKSDYPRGKIPKLLKPFIDKY